MSSSSRKSRGILLLSFLALGVACSTGQTESGRLERSARTRSAIINGVLDRDPPAVVALLLGKNDSFEGACSGTIVKTDPERHIGWVATAAHCVSSAIWQVVQTEDYAVSSVAYSVLDAEADPRYGSTSRDHDFAVVRIGGVDASTPFIPLTTAPDDLTEDQPVTSVGFGQTGDDGLNTKRHAVKKTIGSLSETLIGYDRQVASATATAAVP